jgi:hypothetical protein
VASPRTLKILKVDQIPIESALFRLKWADVRHINYWDSDPHMRGLARGGLRNRQLEIVRVSGFPGLPNKSFPGLLGSHRVQPDSGETS